MWVFFAISALIILIGFIPIRLSAEYGESGFSACLRVLLVKIKFPKEEKKKASDKNAADKKSKDENPGSLKALTSVIKPIFKTLGKLIRKISVRKLVMNLTLSGSDAFSTAMMYGGAAAAISTVFPFIDNNLKIKKKYISVNADFESDESVVYIFADISIFIWQIAVLAIYFLYQYIKAIRLKEKKGIESNG